MRRIYRGGVRPGADGRYSTEDVAIISGVTHRQLQWWDERRVVSPVHAGRQGLKGPRRYTRNEVIEIIAVAQLRAKGLPLQKVRAFLRRMQRLLASAPGVDAVIFTDGCRLIEIADAATAVRMMAEAYYPCYVITISSLTAWIPAEQKESSAA